MWPSDRNQMCLTTTAILHLDFEQKLTIQILYCFVSKSFGTQWIPNHGVMIIDQPVHLFILEKENMYI